MVLAFVTQGSETFKNDIVSNVSSPIKYDSPKPDEVLNVDKEIIDYKINADESKFTVIKVEDMFVK